MDTVKDKTALPSASMGCIRLIMVGAGIIVGWFFGYFAVAVIASLLASSHYFSVSPQMPQVLAGLLATLFIFIIPGATAFATAISLSHYVIVLPYLPRTRLRQWVWTTVTSSTGYWLMAMLMLFFTFDSKIFGLETLLRTHEESYLFEMLILIGIMGVGAVIGAVSGTILGMFQWLMLRSYLPNANWWLVAIIASSAMIVATFIGAVEWVTRNGGWN